METDEALERLRALGDPQAVAGRARFGLPETDTLGVSLPRLRRLAKEIGRDEALARGLWRTGVHDARMLATLVADPASLSRPQVERWLRDVASWDLCDALALNLVDKTPWAWTAAAAWSRSLEAWTRRAGLATMAGLAWHDKAAADARFAPFFPLAEKAALDGRNEVKKATSWALRQMGKRSPALRTKALGSARRLLAREEASARWVGRDVRRELDVTRGITTKRKG